MHAAPVQSAASTASVTSAAPAARPGPARQVALCGLLTALMLVLGYLESLFPLSGAMPGLKLGLSNTVLLYAVYLLPAPTAFALLGLKAGLSALLFAGPMALWFSLAGGLLSLCVMLPLSRLRGVSVLGVSIAGALAHNLGQMLVAVLVLGTGRLWVYFAVLMLSAGVTGLLTGWIARLCIRHLGALAAGRG